MKIGCCIDLSYYDQLVACGYDSIALAAKDVAAWSEEAFVGAQTILAQGKLQTISLNSFCTPQLRLNGSGFDPERLAAYAQLVCRRGSVLGFRYVGIGAPASRNVAPGENPRRCMDQFCQAMAIICQEAGEYGMEILLESVCSLEGNFLTTTAQTFALVRQLAIPNLHLVYDIYHEAMEKQNLDVIAQCAQEIRVVHIAQDVNGTRAYLNAAQADQYRAYWRALRAVGYTGEWNLEAFAGDPSKLLPESMEIMRKIQRD